MTKRALNINTIMAYALDDRRGMTLVEIMIVLAVIAALMTTVGVCTVNAMERAKIKDTHLKLHKVSNKIQEYCTFKTPKVIPDTLHILVTPPNGEPSYLGLDDIQDGWHQEIRYEQLGEGRFSLRSPGPDGHNDTDDDIVWEDEG